MCRANRLSVLGDNGNSWLPPIPRTCYSCQFLVITETVGYLQYHVHATASKLCMGRGDDRYWAFLCWWKGLRVYPDNEKFLPLWNGIPGEEIVDMYPMYIYFNYRFILLFLIFMYSLFWKWGAIARYYTSHTKTMLPMRKSVPRSSWQSDHTKTAWQS